MKTYLPEHEYTIYKFGPVELVWQHNRPQNWLMILTKFFSFEWEVAAPKYRKILQFGIFGQIRRSGLSIQFMFIWLYMTFEFGQIETYPFAEWMK